MMQWCMVFPYHDCKYIYYISDSIVFFCLKLILFLLSLNFIVGLFYEMPLISHIFAIKSAMNAFFDEDLLRNPILCCQVKKSLVARLYYSILNSISNDI